MEESLFFQLIHFFLLILILSIVRQCYNEIALAFSHTLKLRDKPMTPESNESDPFKNRRRSSAKPLLKPSPLKQPFSKEAQRMSRGAWVAIRTAGVIAKAQRKCELLAGDPSITSQSMDAKSWESVPPFILEDLTGVENADKNKDAEEGSYGIKFTKLKVEVTWVHLLKYFTHLRRHCSYSSLALGDFDRALVRVPFHSHVRAIKLAAVCQYLCGNLTVFNKECVPIFPMDLISSLVASVVIKRTSGTDISQPVSPSPMRTPSDIPENQGKKIISLDLICYRLGRLYVTLSRKLPYDHEISSKVPVKLMQFNPWLFN